MEIEADLEIDCRNLKCPLPVARVRKALEQLAPGQLLKMTSNITGGVKCLPIWSAKSGHPIIATEREGEAHVYYIRRNPNGPPAPST